MATHEEMYLAVQVPLLAAMKKEPALRPSYGTAVQYWLAPEEWKWTYRPTSCSRYPALMRAAMQVAKKQEKAFLAEILKLGNSFRPLTP